MAKRLDVVSIAMTGCAVVMVALAVRNAFATRPKAFARPTSATAVDMRPLLSAQERLGNQSIPASIVVFSDFQCPFCRSLAWRLHTVMNDHHDSITVAFHNYPLTEKHDYAWAAALAAECAADQGRFETYHDALFAKQDSLASVNWMQLAVKAGIPDTAKFSRCVRTEQYAAVVRRDMALGDSIGVSATPAVIIDGVMYRGAPSIEDLRSRVAAALAKSQTASRH
jgi:protein-disulfide isomerase